MCCTLTLRFPSGAIASILEIPAHASPAAVARIVAAGLALAHARGWEATYTATTGDVMTWSADRLAHAGRLLSVAEVSHA